jgi:hypothetical protein
MTKLAMGRIYHDGELDRMTLEPLVPSDLRVRLTERLAATGQWDREDEAAFVALRAVMDWHIPWRHWEQIFKPTYIGTRYLGVGCRSCDWRSERDCPTVVAIATAFNIT